MDIQTKNIELKVNLPISTKEIDKCLQDMQIKPLRYAIVKVDKELVTISVTYENL